MTQTPGLGALWWFIAIVALIPFALRLLRRTPLGRGGAGVLRHVAVLPLSPNQRIVTVEVGSGAARRWLVLGVTAQAIQTLHTMEPQDETVTPAPAPAQPFAALLSRLRAPSSVRPPDESA